MFKNSFDNESPSVFYNERLYFPPSVQQKERCITYNVSRFFFVLLMQCFSSSLKCFNFQEEIFCENDIRQIYLKPNGKLRVCGTFGAKGQCRYYTVILCFVFT